MQNQEIIKAIDNLKGRRQYEEKKALKLGFSSLYDYFEDKVLKQKKVAEIQEREIKLLNKNSQNTKDKKQAAVVVKFVLKKRYLFFT